MTDSELTMTTEEVNWLCCAVDLVTSMHHPDTIPDGPEAFAAMRHAAGKLVHIKKTQWEDQ